MQLPDDLRYASTHEWVRVDGDRATIGITDHAQHELGDVVYLDLPAVGRTFRSGAAFGSIESVKAVSDLYAPISGEVLEVNQPLLDSPELVNSDPYGAGWMLAIRIAEPAELDALMDASAYEASAGSH
ncbi:MAG: glycine cleavage system protein [Armatimonadetes bacterium]|nr:glycine cleavage system protein [Armatimonadota bacterium]